MRRACGWFEWISRSLLRWRGWAAVWCGRLVLRWWVTGSGRLVGLVLLCSNRVRIEFRHDVLSKLLRCRVELRQRLRRVPRL